MSVTTPGQVWTRQDNGTWQATPLGGGVSGKQGDKGDTGATGAQGPPGVDGAPGGTVPYAQFVKFGG